MKKILLFLPIFTLVACDNVDISKYSEDIQNCYNKTISSEDNCTENKKIIVKYCECISTGKAEIKAPNGESVSDSIRAWVDMQKLRDKCAEKTGYTFCEEDEVTTE